MKRLWKVLVAIAAAVLLVVLIGVPLYVLPPAGDPKKSDAILVLGPPTEQRIALAEELRDEGVSDLIIVSVQKSGGQTEQDLDICRDEGVRCDVPDPFTTRGEVLLISENSAASDPPSLTVVTFTPHVMRARYIFGKCYAGDVTVVSTNQPLSFGGWAYQYLYQSVAFVKALFEPCPEVDANG